MISHIDHANICSSINPLTITEFVSHAVCSLFEKYEFIEIINLFIDFKQQTCVKLLSISKHLKCKFQWIML